MPDAQTDREKIAAILAFWFGEAGPKKWYEKDAAFDETIATRFGDDIEAALRGDYDGWGNTPAGLLALILLLDQMTRNTFRDTPKAFAGDARALALSIKAHESGMLAEEHDASRRQFMLMPMMHAEDIKVQDASLPLFEKYTNAETHKYAVMHRDIIARFGHFPHRNAILGRKSTDEELAFLQEPNSSF